MINLYEYTNIRTHWIAIYVGYDPTCAVVCADIAGTAYVAYFDDFGVEHFTQEIKKAIFNQNTITNNFRTQPFNLIICR